MPCPTDLQWREDAPPAHGRSAAAPEPVPPMLRLRAVLRAALTG
jgi:hypothetical protein